MKTVLCTLYNSYYLDKGLVLYDSLKEISSDFLLYILCMDEKCYDVLSDINADYMVPIKLGDVENEELLQVKKTRSLGEYCWTLTPSLILYVLENYKEQACTYIDADMFFYQDPQILIKEMLQAKKTVMIIPHRFPPENERLLEKGIYCVEFNTFVNEKASLNVLKEWQNNCMENCSLMNGHYGDQKYLDIWPEKYSSIVHVCQHPGAGVAPWNISWYKKKDGTGNVIYYKKEEKYIPVVFFHFQHLTYITRDLINTNIDSNRSTIDYKLVDSFYSDYLRKIEKKKDMLEKEYDLDYVMKEHPIITQNGNWKRWLKRFRIVSELHKLICPYKYREGYIINLCDSHERDL